MKITAFLLFSFFFFFWFVIFLALETNHENCFKWNKFTRTFGASRHTVGTGKMQMNRTLHHVNVNLC